MTAQRTDIALLELIQLLTQGELAETSRERVLARAQLAFDDPELFITRYPDADWLVEGLDLYADSLASTRLLTHILIEDLREWLLTGRHPLMVAERIIDRLAMHGVRIADPPSHLRTLAEHCAYLTEQLASLAPPRILLKLESVAPGPAFAVLPVADAVRAGELAKTLSLPLRVVR